MSNWLFFCAGFTQVGSVILQANEDDYRCRSAPDTKFGFNFRSGLKHKSSNDQCKLFLTFSSYAIELSPADKCKGFDYNWTASCEAFNKLEASIDDLVGCLSRDNPEEVDCDDWIFDTTGRF